MNASIRLQAICGSEKFWVAIEVRYIYLWMWDNAWHTQRWGAGTKADKTVRDLMEVVSQRFSKVFSDKERKSFLFPPIPLLVVIKKASFFPYIFFFFLSLFSIVGGQRLGSKVDPF
jgi:hypothetical protein